MRIRYLFILLFLSALPYRTEAEIKVWVDEDGIQHFSNMQSEDTDEAADVEIIPIPKTEKQQVAERKGTIRNLEKELCARIKKQIDAGDRPEGLLQRLLRRFGISLPGFSDDEDKPGAPSDLSVLKDLYRRQGCEDIPTDPNTTDQGLVLDPATLTEQLSSDDCLAYCRKVTGWAEEMCTYLCRGSGE